VNELLQTATPWDGALLGGAVVLAGTSLLSWWRGKSDGKTVIADEAGNAVLSDLTQLLVSIDAHPDKAACVAAVNAAMKCVNTKEQSVAKPSPLG
jgi:hypothetical protein